MVARQNAMAAPLRGSSLIPQIPGKRSNRAKASSSPHTGSPEGAEHEELRQSIVGARHDMRAWRCVHQSEPSPPVRRSHDDMDSPCCPPTSSAGSRGPIARRYAAGSSRRRTRRGRGDRTGRCLRASRDPSRTGAHRRGRPSSLRLTCRRGATRARTLAPLALECYSQRRTSACTMWDAGMGKISVRSGQ